MSKRYGNPLVSNVYKKRSHPTADVDWQERGRDWLVFPGYKYLGLNSSMKKGPPKDKLDQLAYIHDLYYAYYTRLGLDPYKNWNYADAQFIAMAKPLLRDPSVNKDALLTSLSYFYGKRASYTVGGIGEISLTDSERARFDRGMTIASSNPFDEKEYYPSEEKEYEPVPAPDPDQMDEDATKKGFLVGVVPCYLQVGNHWITIFPRNVVGMNHK